MAEAQPLTSTRDPESAKGERANPLPCRFMREAFELARIAFDSGEVPVGCVLVQEGRVVGRGFNQPNRTGNATRHAEFVAVDDALGTMQESPRTKAEVGNRCYLDTTDGDQMLSGSCNGASPLDFAKVDVYVTVEPCVMCAAALMELGVASITYGCANERFGGVESVKQVCEDLVKLKVLSENDLSHSSGCDAPKHYRLPKIVSGVRAGEAVDLLRQFYERGNPSAPKPKRPRQA